MPWTCKEIHTEMIAWVSQFYLETLQDQRRGHNHFLFSEGSPNTRTSSSTKWLERIWWQRFKSPIQEPLWTENVTILAFRAISTHFQKRNRQESIPQTLVSWWRPFTLHVMTAPLGTKYFPPRVVSLTGLTDIAPIGPWKRRVSRMQASIYFNW